MITLNASGGSVTFTFDGNSTYLNDGTITVPVNSLALIIDESDMVTFKKSQSSDIFVSANIAEFGMTKDELMAWFKANAVGSTGGGGKAIEAGRGISVTTGETADTVSFNLPISAGTGTNSIKENYSGNTATGSYSHAEGYDTTASGIYSHAEGYSTTASDSYSHAEGCNTTASSIHSHAEGISTTANGNASHAEGQGTTAYGKRSHVEGNYTIANNFAEHASGCFNVSSSASTIFGNSGNTLFSVGNGIDDDARHNAFEVRQNGDIYIADTSSTGEFYEKTMIKLQDVISNILNRLTTIENNS